MTLSSGRSAAARRSAVWFGPCDVSRTISSSREVLDSPGDGAVLVIRGGGSIHTALVGDQIGAAAVANGWAGLVSAVRDSEALADLDL